MKEQQDNIGNSTSDVMDWEDPGRDCEEILSVAMYLNPRKLCLIGQAHGKNSQHVSSSVIKECLI